MFNGKRLSGWMALAVFATVGGAMVAADPAFAKVDVDKLTINGEIRERYEVRTNASMNVGSIIPTGTGASGGSNKGNASYASQRVRLGVGYELTPDVSFFAQLQDARSFGSEGTNAATTTGIQAVSNTNTNSTGVDLHQGYIQVKNVLVPGLSLKAGRQEIIYGDHRLFGNFGWSQVGNSFDAVKLMHTTQMMDVDLFWARIFDSAGQTNQASNNNSILFPATSTATQTGAQDIYGAYVTLKPVKNWTIEPYYFLLSDYRNIAGSSLVQAQAPGQTRSTLGGRVNGKAEGLDFTYEGAWQFGSMADQCARGLTAGCTTGGFAVDAAGSRNLRINAAAHALKTGYTFAAVPMKPRLGFEFDYASGDGNVNRTPGMTGNGNLSQGHANTFDNLYPTNHFHYGYMDLMAWRNMVNYQANFAVNPSPVSKLQFNYIIHRLAKTEDNWYRAGQATYFTSKVTNQEASLGQELDVHYWHTFKEKFKFELGYGHFFAGAYLDKSVDSTATAAGQGGTGFGLAAGNRIVDQNWGYMMGSILF